VVSSITLGQEDDYHQIDPWLRQHAGAWIFGHISYDLKTSLHHLPDTKPERIGFAPLSFFVPRICVVASGDRLEIISQDPAIDPRQFWNEVCEAPLADALPAAAAPDIRPRLSRNAYLEIIEKLRGHILRGDCYEINFCQEFFAEGADIEPLSIYHALAEASPNPFSCYYRQGDAHLMCASPERYLTRRGHKVFSQPIKGTAPRNLQDAGADEAAAQDLRQSPKERSENVMVVDLVRNDLSQVCEKGSVRVDELYGIYSYPQVHQMISTVSGTLPDTVEFSRILAATFPMGSMTGAPKRRVMELIDRYEASRRGLFSGAVGYFSPTGDFDFNVVIRSILYNASSRYLSYLVGSGITWYCEPEKEYEECLLKGSAIRRVLDLGFRI
jgi:para-aminobenzoate synthetase component 1